MNIETRIAQWPQESDIIGALRKTVFIEEQGVSPEIEMDGKDELPATQHYLGFINNTAVATGRVLASGKIGRICLLKDYRKQGMGKSFLRALLIHLLESSDQKKFYLHAQIHALSFYQQCGFAAEGEVFQEANIDHQCMRINFENEDAIAALYADRVIRCQAVEDFERHACRMINAGRRKVDILSNELHHELYGANLTRALSRFVRHHRVARVRILVQDTRNLPKRRHPLILLAQRLPSSVIIKQLTEAPQKPEQGYISVDQKALLFFNDEASWEGFANYQARAESMHQLEEFERLWQQHSRSDPNLARLSL